MSAFGQHDPRQMPPHLFMRALRLDYATAVRSNPERQNRSICPRHWYVDATFACERCGGEFQFTASEQRVWYEEYGFWVDSLPRHCVACRRSLRDARTLRQEYDRTVAETLEHGDNAGRQRLAAVIDRLYELGGDLPPRINDNRRRLANQIAVFERSTPIMSVINLADKLALFSDHWRPRTVARFNDCDVMVVKVKGEFVWHKHDDTDDFFLVLRGRLHIRLRDRVVTLNEGELFIVPRGVEHQPFAEEETHVLLIEPKGTPNTGDAATAAPRQEI